MAVMFHTQFNPLSAHAPGSEFTDKAGAAELKARIEAYWRAKGHDVQVVLVEGAFTPALRASRIDVRSDLVNGLPRKARVA